jgi:ribosomal protein S18 acetylase RimI-like enzyme
MSHRTSGAVWRRAIEADQAAIRSFIEPREMYATGFSSRLLEPADRRGRTGIGSVFLLYAELESGKQDILAAALLASNGSVFPVLADRLDHGGPQAVVALSALGRLRSVRGYDKSVCIGARQHTEALERALGWMPTLSVDYDVMSVAPVGNATTAGVAGTSVEYRRAALADLDALYPLAADYERTEVMTELHTFDPSLCRAIQRRSLERHIVYLASVGNRVVARAQTNAHGWTFDQIGGVYVDPEYRGLGIGRGVVNALLDDITGRGRGATLFVKKSNAIARSLYHTLGFSMIRDYRISYF